MKIKPVNAGDYIDASVTAGSTRQGHYAANVTGIYGISGDASPKDTHDNHKSGLTMWLSDNNPGKDAWLLFDFGKAYPIGEMWVWNYNQFDAARPEIQFVNRGIKNATIHYSIDSKNWMELKGPGYPYRFAKADGSIACPATNLDDGRNSPVDFGGVTARYVRITPNNDVNGGNRGGSDGSEAVFGLCKVRFYVGRGLLVETAEEWTELFHRYSGWTGSDGIYSTPLSGLDQRGTASTTKTLFTFGDTLIGDTDPVTGRRSDSWKMINNSMAILSGNEPDSGKIEFIWGRNGNYRINSVIIPSTTSVSASDKEESYYWLSDSVSINSKLHTFAMLVQNEPTGIEGFEFKVVGISLISTPLGQEGPELEKNTQKETPLYQPLSDGSLMLFGSGTMANTIEAGVPNPDGYVYVYGVKSASDSHPARQMLELIAARVPEQSLESFDEWRYWDGRNWSEDILSSRGIASGVCHELSVTPMEGGLFDGKYLLVYQNQVSSGIIACRIGDSPVGPFGEMIPLYCATEAEEGKGIYVYHGKAHPHLSKPGQLLISYNVNSVSFDMHVRKGDIYRPHFICISEIL